MENGFSLLPEWVKGYVAGIIDGEGHIRLFWTGYGWHPEIKVNMTHVDTIKWLCETLSIGNVTNKTVEGNRKEQKVWTVHALMDGYSLLKELLPFLRVKRRHAELIIEFCELKITDRYMLSDGNRIKNELSVLNKRGKD